MMNATDHGTSAPPARTPPTLPKAPPLVIGLAGAPDAGRKSVASWLKRKHGFAIASFDQPLRDAVQMLYGVSPVELLYDPRQHIERLGRSASHLIDELRDHAGKLAGADILTRRLVERAQSRGEWGQQDIVITDVSTAAEIRWLRAVGGSVWWIRRPVLDAPAAVPTAAMTEIMKLALEQWMAADMAVINDGTPDALQFKVDVLMRRARQAQEATSL